MRPFRDLEVWKGAHALTLDVYGVTKAFPREELFGVTSQLRRASSSVAANIAEGSVCGEREFARYLRVALGSATETEYFIVLSRDLGYLSGDTHDALIARSQSLQRMLVAFGRAVTNQSRRPMADSRRPS